MPPQGTLATNYMVSLRGQAPSGLILEQSQVQFKQLQQGKSVGTHQHMYLCGKPRNMTGSVSVFSLSPHGKAWFDTWL